ncbi:hypothetical protein C7H19_01410 [Aphanothece hegewaldii CCALA 016]|uniref:Uncharacterized protein n=1 Tax=Aphanothece hegewaldii CCALA 016 TaxID=2107694 RepID=A0A2T1M3Q5_9CHRO|nr:hypothetical protein [Aphanothece hegewaldii]PSF39474.1 hypothetical protein C7H19_01410 [Aphanothece hegewaldii CCALA 016]
MSDPRVEQDTYDRGIVPAETAARKEREGEDFKHIPDTDNPSIDTTGGYTVDREGLLNNYAVEPEMYYEEPGDAAAIEAQEKAERKATLEDANDHDESGKLTEEKDSRGKGVGII